MPDNHYPPPAGDTGALTYPRQLNKWLDVNPQGGALRRCQTFITLPSFTTTASWNGYSDIAASFNFEASSNFSLKYPYLVASSPNYVLCISYRVGGTVTRYMLWNATGSNMNQQIPSYTGQPILKNFRLEIWNTSQGSASDASSHTFYTSKLQPIDYRWGTDAALVNNDGQVSVFTCGVSGNLESVLVTNAGTAAANGTYYSNTVYNGRSEYSLNADLSNGYRIRYYDGIGWQFVHLVGLTTFVLYKQDPIDVASQPYEVTTWLLEADGTNPVPLVNFFQSYNSYTLPLVFPANSVSVTN